VTPCSGLEQEVTSDRKSGPGSGGEAAVSDRPVPLLEATNAALSIQLKQAVEQLHRASRAQSDLLANVSHELRTPLTAIVGFTDLLMDGEDGSLNPRQLEDAETIRANGRRLLKLIDDLIDMAAIGADRLELQIDAIESTAALVVAIDEVRPLAGTKGIALTLDAPAQQVIKADRRRFHEMAVNLLSNAVKFTPSGGMILVRATDQADIDEDGRPMAMIEVIDSGIGVAVEDRERIFEKFERIAGPDVPGTGLGLAITRELAHLHDGSLTVESTPGLGSRFILRLPLVERPAEPVQPVDRAVA
jgi:signal transduction histidine kinase